MFAKKKKKNKRAALRNHYERDDHDDHDLDDCVSSSLSFCIANEATREYLSYFRGQSMFIYSVLLYNKQCFQCFFNNNNNNKKQTKKYKKITCNK